MGLGREEVGFDSWFCRGCGTGGKEKRGGWIMLKRWKKWGLLVLGVLLGVFWVHFSVLAENGEESGGCVCAGAGGLGESLYMGLG